METAFAIARDSSIEELTIPLIAKSLDVGVTSIYWHVRNKSELLDAMTDRALRHSELPAFTESHDWRESLLAHARGVRRTFLGDPVLTDLILIRGALSPMARRLGDQETQKAIANMLDSGLDEQTAHATYSAVSELVRGSVLLARLAQQHRAPGPRDDGPFELLLTSLLASDALQVAARGSGRVGDDGLPSDE